MAERGAGGGMEARENNLSHRAVRCRFSQRMNGIHCLSLKPRSCVVSCVSLPRSPDAPDAGGLGNVRRTNHGAPSGIFLWLPFGPLQLRQARGWGPFSSSCSCALAAGREDYLPPFGCFIVLVTSISLTAPPQQGWKLNCQAKLPAGSAWVGTAKRLDPAIALGVVI